MTPPAPMLSFPQTIPSIDRDAQVQAELRQSVLAKPSGALGRLEELAVRLAGMQRTARPSASRVHITVFVGDHGVAMEGISAYPQSVTSEMLRTFAVGGAAISVLAREIGAQLEVVNLGTLSDPVLGPGTRNFLLEPAMTESQLERALDAGREAAERARRGDADLFIGGDMGIGNTTAAAALSAALLELRGSDLAGAGSGLAAEGIARKASLIDAALERHAGSLSDPLEAVRRVSGFEIAALVGSFTAAAALGVPILVDGFIATAAALAAVRLTPGVGEWLIYAHRGAERGHGRLLEALEARPVLDLGMRLGEGTGAAVAVPLLRLACALHARMSTFDEAGVSGRPH